MSGRGLENYIEVKPRLAQFRKEHPTWTLESTYDTSIAEALVFKTLIKDDQGRVIAVGHACATDLSEDKIFEKTETGSLGRALELAGYISDSRYVDAPEGQPEAATSKPAPKANPLANKAAASKPAAAAPKANPLASKAATTKLAAKPAAASAPAVRRLGGLSKPAPAPVEQSEESYEVDTDDTGSEESFDEQEA